MLRKTKEFKSFKLRTRDGDIGKVKEFYFDDKHWTVRYLVADTGGWLSGSRILISPYALEPGLEGERVLPVDLTKKQIEDSLSMNSEKPVSRQHEDELHTYYGWARRLWNFTSHESNVAGNVPGNDPPATRRYGGWGILWLVILAVIVVLLIAMWWR